MEVPMQSAPDRGRVTAESAPRVPGTNRTLVWFSGEAEQRRRRAAAAQEELGAGPPRQAVWQRTEVFGCVALAALALALLEGPMSAVGAHPCRTDPVMLASGADLDVIMTLSHNAACAIRANPQGLSVKDVTITTVPQHGTLALRGRTGVTYRPAHGFAGRDSFAFTLQSASGSGAALTARVHVTVH
jgi:hypothetical protein